MYQDLKFRHIHIVSLVFLIITSFVIAFREESITDVLQWSLISFCFLALQLGLTFAYFKVVRGNRMRIDQQLGLGDILFYIAIIPLFHFYNFILYYCLSLLFALLLYAVSSLVGIKKIKYIPLAGYSSMVLVMIILYKLVFTLNLYKFPLF